MTIPRHPLQVWHGTLDARHDAPDDPIGFTTTWYLLALIGPDARVRHVGVYSESHPTQIGNADRGLWVTLSTWTGEHDLAMEHFRHFADYDPYALPWLAFDGDRFVVRVLP